MPKVKIEHKFVVAKIDYNGRITLTDDRMDTREEAVTEIERRLNLDVMGSETYTIVETWTEGR